MRQSFAGKPIGLANKECMVAAGEISDGGSNANGMFPFLLIDSEDNAVHQCMQWVLMPR